MILKAMFKKILVIKSEGDLEAYESHPVLLKLF